MGSSTSKTIQESSSQEIITSEVTEVSQEVVSSGTTSQQTVSSTESIMGSLSQLQGDGKQINIQEITLPSMDGDLVAQSFGGIVSSQSSETVSEEIQEEIVVSESIQTSQKQIMTTQEEVITEVTTSESGQLVTETTMIIEQ